MARISFNDVNQIDDVLDQTGFQLIFGSIPGAGSSNTLTVMCQNVSIPGTGNEVYEAALHGHVRKFRGRRTYPRTMSVTFYEDQKLYVHTKIRSWLEFIAGSESGNSRGYSKDYSVEAQLNILDTTGKVIGTNIITNVFPESLEDVQMDGSSSQGVSVSATFSYDLFRDSNVSAT